MKNMQELNTSFTANVQKQLDCQGKQKYAPYYDLSQKPDVLILSGDKNKKENNNKVVKALAIAFTGVAAVLGVACIPKIKKFAFKFMPFNFFNQFGVNKGPSCTSRIINNARNTAGISGANAGKIQRSRSQQLKNAHNAVNAGIGAANDVNLTPLHRSSSWLIEKAQKKGRIRATLITNGKKAQTIELPEYLYHVTNGISYGQIKESGSLNRSLNEQLPGIFLLDSENFFQHYAQTDVAGQKMDLITTLFKHVNRGSAGVPFSQREAVVIKIPTIELLKKGKLRIRTQEDFFEFQKFVKDKSGLGLRELADPKKREDFRKMLIEKGEMTKDEIEKFMDEMYKKIHQGYLLPDAVNLGLERTNSIEYVFNKDIRFSDFDGIGVAAIKLPDLTSVSESNSRYFDLEKIRRFFESF